MKIGIIREGKVPVDKRVPLLPYQCRLLCDQYPQMEFFVQPSPVRCVSEEAYRKYGIEVREDLSQCDLLFGVKEVPVKDLLGGKTYFFFSHTIKKQTYNRPLLQEILKRKIQLIDYECLKDELGNRIVAFGRFAGVVGAYNALLAYGLRNHLFELRRAYECAYMKALKAELEKVKLPPVKIVVTGTGRVGRGAKEILEALKIKQVFPTEFLEDNFGEAVYTMLSSDNYYVARDNSNTGFLGFYTHPENYYADFLKYARQSDLMISAHYWNPGAEALFTLEDTARKDFKIRIIADVTCDIEGSVPTTLKTTQIEDPFYDFDPLSCQIQKAFSSENHITVMAVDNLPCELPYDASESFGEQLIANVFPALMEADKKKLIEYATIAKNGVLTEEFSYLEDFVRGLD